MPIKEERDERCRRRDSVCLVLLSRFCWYRRSSVRPARSQPERSRSMHFLLQNKAASGPLYSRLMFRRFICSGRVRAFKLATRSAAFGSRKTSAPARKRLRFVERITKCISQRRREGFLSAGQQAGPGRLENIESISISMAGMPRGWRFFYRAAGGVGGGDLCGER